METKLVKPTDDMILLASELLKKGEVVGVPTETVYGLAGDSSNASAIKKIFIAKGRPMDNPLICHISNFKMLDKVAKDLSSDAMKLARTFWPGPLTIVVKRGDCVCLESTAGLDSVGIRMPSNEVARKIIEKAGIPFSAPSANLSGKPSPTTAKDVFCDMQGKIPLIIDGGECDAGVESTVVSVLGKTPVLLRPGVVTKEQIESVLGKKIEVAKGVLEQVAKDEKVLSPGMKYHHYAPNASVIIIKSDFEKFKEYVEKNKTDGAYALLFDGEKVDLPSLYYGGVDDDKAQAHNLFSKLREFDKLGAKTVFARCPKQTGVGLAVYNRLIRSAGFHVIEL